MALIENTVGNLPYLMTDFDQHSYEAEDAFTRFMPKDKLRTAVRTIKAPGFDHKVLLANDRIVTRRWRTILTRHTFRDRWSRC
jgi:hypothetical protein